MFTLNEREAAYVVAALRMMIDRAGEDRDREVMTSIMLRLAAGLRLDDDVRRAIDR